MDENETKKVAIVTGGSRGIGRAVSLRLAKDGYNIVFGYRKGEEEAKKTQKECEEYGSKVLAVRMDVSKSSDCDEMLKKTLEVFGRVDVLVNNAGITRDNLIMKLTDEDLDSVIDVNLKGTFYMMRAVSRQMLRQKMGHIINMSSVVGVMGNAGQVNYAAGKAAVIGMTKSLARELASRKICVNAIAPGMIATDMTASLSDSVKEGILSKIPFHEMGTAEDVANMVAFLASDDSRYITGQVFAVDGGMSC